MNERIKELYKQAGLTMNNPLAYEQWYLDSLEKFAELIVAECVGEIHGADVGDLKGKSYYLDKVAEHIEKHFGVE